MEPNNTTPTAHTATTPATTGAVPTTAAPATEIPATAPGVPEGAPRHPGDRRERSRDNGTLFLGAVVEAVHAALTVGPVSVAQIAKEMHLTEQSFRRRIHKHTSQSPKAFFSALQMQRAVELLADHTLPVSRVAAMCGFETCSSFCHKFKQVAGCSPSCYRESS